MVMIPAHPPLARTFSRFNTRQHRAAPAPLRLRLLSWAICAALAGLGGGALADEGGDPQIPGGGRGGQGTGEGGSGPLDVPGEPSFMGNGGAGGPDGTGGAGGLGGLLATGSVVQSESVSGDAGQSNDPGGGGGGGAGIWMGAPFTSVLITSEAQVQGGQGGSVGNCGSCSMAGGGGGGGAGVAGDKAGVLLEVDALSTVTGGQGGSLTSDNRFGGAGGGGRGIDLRGDASTVLNRGDIYGGTGGKDETGGELVPEGSEGSGGHGVVLSGAGGRVENQGLILGGSSDKGKRGGHGVVLGAQGTLVNGMGAVVVGGFSGTALGGHGVLAEQGAQIENVGGHITAGLSPGLSVAAPSDIPAGIIGQNLSIRNAGWISGARQDGSDALPHSRAIVFTGGANTLALEYGSLIEGAVDATLGDNTLVLGGDIDGACTLLDDGCSEPNMFSASAITGSVSDPSLTEYAGFKHFRKEGASDWVLTDSTTEVTPWTIAGDGVLLVEDNAALGDLSGALAFEGGTLGILGTSFSDFGGRPVEFGSGGGGLNINEQTHTFTLSNDLGGTGPLLKLGAGTLALTGRNTYEGGTVVAQGTLRAGSATGLPQNTPYLVATGARLELAGHDLTMAGLFEICGCDPDDPANVALGGATLTLDAAPLSVGLEYSGIITGEGNLIKSGEGSYMFTGATPIRA